MKARTGEAIALHIAQDGLIRADADTDAEAELTADGGQLVPMGIRPDAEIPMGMEQVRIREIETQAYKGPTVAVPRVGAEVILPTQGYKLLKDIRVLEVQVDAVHAPGGGLVYRIE